MINLSDCFLLLGTVGNAIWSSDSPMTWECHEPTLQRRKWRHRQGNLPAKVAQLVSSWVGMQNQIFWLPGHNIILTVICFGAFLSLIQDEWWCLAIQSQRADTQTSVEIQTSGQMGEKANKKSELGCQSHVLDSGQQVTCGWRQCFSYTPKPLIHLINKAGSLVILVLQPFL